MGTTTLGRHQYAVTFLLPGTGALPIGGFKVVYEYANGLARRGYRVTVVHASLCPTDPPPLPTAFRRYVLSYSKQTLTRGYLPDKWFNLDPRVRTLWVPSLQNWFIPQGDAIVATWWRTAEFVANYPASKGQKIYLVQSLETWGGPEERVLQTWRLPLRKIVISRWLEAIAHELGECATYVPNGLDFGAFGVDCPPVTRPPHRVAMLYHMAQWKGSRDGLAALRLVKERMPALEVELFGVGPVPPELPSWIRYYQDPPQHELRRLYNGAAIFVAPSWTEGWPLPPAEAMMSGCALVATDIGGHREFAIPDETALLTPQKDPAALAIAIERLISNDPLRLGLSERGARLIRQFTWDRALDAFEQVLISERS